MSVSDFTSTNDRQREKIMNMKLRLQNKMQKMNYKPEISNPSSPSLNLNIAQYNSTQSIDKQIVDGAHSRVFEMDFNSTLFKNIKDEESMEKSDQFQNYNSAAFTSNINPSYQPQQSNFISKIDEVLNKNKGRGKVPTPLYEQVVNKKEPQKFDISSISQKSSLIYPQNMNKLKTIQEQIGNTLTINKQTIQQERRKKQETDRKSTTRSGRPPLATSSTIQKHKEKIRQAMGQIRKIEKIDQIEFQDKESIVFDLSDNESQLQDETMEKPKAENKEKNQKKEALLQEKRQLEEELKGIEEELDKLEKEEENQY